MVKEVYFFTEMGFTAYPQDEARRRGYNNLMFPNEHFSPERARELYAMYFDELLYATETGFDGVMINEHHNNPLSMPEFKWSSQHYRCEPIVEPRRAPRPVFASQESCAAGC
jgi:alkanesulfonate monooxygenase SsuD/methylene tetrahydromethanopterin reductase-like flavin-dependent oxidoreductase (luciferase family)